MLLAPTIIRARQDGKAVRHFQAFGTAGFDTQPAPCATGFDNNRNPFVGHAHGRTRWVPRKDSGVAGDAVM
jgi:hypothetical protein